MKSTATSCPHDEREQWRARILRAQEELRVDHELLSPRVVRDDRGARSDLGGR